MENNFIDNAFDFYSIDKQYKNKTQACLNEIYSNKKLKTKFCNLFDILYTKNTDEFRSLWKIKDPEMLFWKDVNPFATNLMILMGWQIHKESMEKLEFYSHQILSQKQRVRECFVNDLEKRNYAGVRISQMLWATYFINGRIIEVGNLQYEYDSSIDKIKIHIPAMQKLNIEEAKKSIAFSKQEIEKYFGLKRCDYICESWLLSKEIGNMLSKKSNIKKFQEFFVIEDGPNCQDDILNFVFGVRACNDFKQLPEFTSLQKSVKKCLLERKVFKEGIGMLKEDL